MAELFAVDRTSVTRHIRNIYKSQELALETAVSRNGRDSSIRSGMLHLHIFAKHGEDGEYHGLIVTLIIVDNPQSFGECQQSCHHQQLQRLDSDD